MIQRDQASGVGPALPLAPPVFAQAAPGATSEAGPDPATVAPQALSPQGGPPVEGGQATAPAPPEQAVDNNTFYTALSPYGTWMQVEGYGLVWQPTVSVVNASWQPYYDAGRWVWSDSGYYWISDYSWGWAPFHYGRWFRHARAGWCWAPDTVWGPAWVTWRYDTAYCGWAPLPPSAYYRPGFGFYYYGSPVGWGFSWGLGYGYFNFVSYSHFHARHLHRYRVDRYYCERVYHHGKHGGWRNDPHYPRPVNVGPGVHNVSQHTKLEKVTLREQPTLGGKPGQFPSGRAERLEGRTLTVYKPTVKPLTSPTTTLAGSAAVGARRMPDAGHLAGSAASRTPDRPGSSLVGRDSMSKPAPFAPGSTAVSPRLADSSARPGSSLVDRSSMGSKPAPAPVPSPTPSVASPSVNKPSVNGRAPNRLVQTPNSAPAHVPAPSANPAPSKSQTVAPLSSAPSAPAAAPNTARREYPGSRLAERPTYAPSPAPSAPTAPAAPRPQAAPAPSYSAPGRSVPSYSAPSYSAPSRAHSGARRATAPSRACPELLRTEPVRAELFRPEGSPRRHARPLRPCAPPVRPRATRHRADQRPAIPPRGSPHRRRPGCPRLQAPPLI